jgi:ketosteroid isomerase-like protein
MERRGLLIAVAALTAVLPASASASQSVAPNPEVLAVVDAALNAAQAGDIQSLRQKYTADCIFIDEFAPFMWSGADALDHYFQSAAQMYQETRHSDVTVTKGTAKYVYVAADSAYVIEPLSETAQVNGKPYTSSGSLTFVLVRTQAGWKIRAQTWAKDAESSNPY